MSSSGILSQAVVFPPPVPLNSPIPHSGTRDWLKPRFMGGLSLDSWVTKAAWAIGREPSSSSSTAAAQQQQRPAARSPSLYSTEYTPSMARRTVRGPATGRKVAPLRSASQAFFAIGDENTARLCPLFASPLLPAVSRSVSSPPAI